MMNSEDRISIALFGKTMAEIKKDIAIAESVSGKKPDENTIARAKKYIPDGSDILYLKNNNSYQTICEMAAIIKDLLEIIEKKDSFQTCYIGEQVKIVIEQKPNNIIIEGRLRNITKNL